MIYKYWYSDLSKPLTFGEYKTDTVEIGNFYSTNVQIVKKLTHELKTIGRRFIKFERGGMMEVKP